MNRRDGFRRLGAVSFVTLALCACGAASRGSGSVQVGTDLKAAESKPAAQRETKAEPTAAARPRGASAPAKQKKTEGRAEERPNREAPVYDSTLVRAGLDRTAGAPDDRARLGLRLAVVEQGPDTPWLLVVVNRGSEPVRLLPDLRTLSLEVTPAVPEPSSDKKRKVVPPPKPVHCVLPRDLVPSEEDSSLAVVLEPGEGIVDEFDPRLYCLPVSGQGPLQPGATVSARLGWPEKTKTIWKKGKREPVVLEQAAPFIAHREMPPGTLPVATESGPTNRDGDARAPRSDSEAVKQLVAVPVTLGSEYAPEPEPADDQPLELRLTRGSDARTERDATISVSLINKSKKPERVLFRRELVSFEVSGPDGMLSCEPGPDDRAPDRENFSLLRPGGRLGATSRLIELCPEGAMRRPGLYLVHGRFRGIGPADPQAPKAFEGVLLSNKPVVVRVRRGWGALPAQHEPQRIRVGNP